MSENGSNGRISGSVSSVVGPVVDFSFTGDDLPEIYDAVYVDLDDDSTLVCEVQQHLGEGAVRAVAMSSTDGMRRGMEGYSFGAPITVPVGPGTLGRIFDVSGNTIDSDEEVEAADRYSIHREPPSFADRSTQAELFETGVK
ncbi:MAG: F0F1 ATP synthase subunit beta, partial [Caldilineaceae bacterium]|nr:F0F1 ATP synthase subunit beta [Caldilineaceae bacterium]